MLLITHCCSSPSNGVTWNDVINIMEDYFANDPYENEIYPPKLTAHTN